MTRAGLSLAILSVASLVAAAPAAPPLAFTTIEKDVAVLRIELEEPASASVAYGTEPGVFESHARSDGERTSHELRLAGLSPDKRYFYQVSVGGVPQPELLTFRSGRSWGEHRAVLLIAQASDLTPGLADRMFAEEADAIVLVALAGTGDGSSHARSMTDRLVVVTPVGQAHRAVTVSDVTVLTDPSMPLPEGTCWNVTATADGILVDGVKQAASAPAGSFIRVESKSGTLFVDARGPGGVSGAASLVKTCPVPGAAAQGSAPATDEDGFETSEVSDDADASTSDCDLP